MMAAHEIIATTPQGTKVGLGVFDTEEFAVRVADSYRCDVGEEYTAIDVVPTEDESLVICDPGEPRLVAVKS